MSNKELPPLKPKPDGMPSYEEVWKQGKRVKPEDFCWFEHSNNWCLNRLGNFVARQGSWSYSMYKVVKSDDGKEILEEIHNSWDYEE